MHITEEIISRPKIHPNVKKKNQQKQPNFSEDV